MDYKKLQESYYSILAKIGKKVLQDSKTKLPRIPGKDNYHEINLAENMHRHKLLKYAFEKAMEDIKINIFKKVFDEDNYTTSETISELNTEKIKEMMASLENIKKSTIVEILVTKLVIDTKTVQILHDKYLCMNPIVWAHLKSISNKSNNTHFFGISVFEGEEANNRYKKYLI